MPKVRASSLSRVKAPETRFTIASTIDGYEVTDGDGRTVSNSYESASQPLLIAQRLNQAAEHGGKSLARALASVEGFEIGLDIDEELV